MRAVVLAWVLVDAAYTYRSLVVEIGYRLLRRETRLSGWNLAAARDELVAAGLLSVRSSGSGRRSRTAWTLRWNKNVRSWGDVSADEKRPSKRPFERPFERPSRKGHESESESEFTPPVVPLQGDASEKNELRGAVAARSNRRRRRRISDDELEAVADRIEWPEDEP
jgi:hypothetical protein